MRWRLSANHEVTGVETTCTGGILASSWRQPTAAELDYLRQAEASLTEALGSFNQVYATEVAAFRRRVEASGLVYFADREPLDLDWRRNR